ncbi:histidine protein methyltransferase 1 isoform X1 [Biomphalaria glabrata]|nr:histidine protein methyltransferase 1 isoform X1 [Biomphalaria glabrata]
MSFMFNFNAHDDEGENTNNKFNDASVDVSKDTKETKDQKLISLPAVEVTDFYNSSVISKLPFKTLTFGEHFFQIVNTKCIEKELLNQEDAIQSSKTVLDAINAHSDLVPGTYEGGLKIWECGIDLVKYLSSSESRHILEVKGKVVLELGCGAGLPGLYSLKAGAKRVDFQDYNIDVLKLLTQPNVVRNCTEQHCRYFAGDWSGLNKIATEHKLRYDVILTAETIYNPENYSKLHDIFSTSLTDDGIILVAAKTYYFGVGGSLDTFVNYVRSCNVFTVDTILTIQEGVPRQIISLKRVCAS